MREAKKLVLSPQDFEWLISGEPLSVCAVVLIRQLGKQHISVLILQIVNVQKILLLERQLQHVLTMTPIYCEGLVVVIGLFLFLYDLRSKK